MALEHKLSCQRVSLIYMTGAALVVGLAVFGGGYLIGQTMERRDQDILTLTRAVDQLSACLDGITNTTLSGQAIRGQVLSGTTRGTRPQGPVPPYSLAPYPVIQYPVTRNGAPPASPRPAGEVGKGALGDWSAEDWLANNPLPGEQP